MPLDILPGAALDFDDAQLALLGRIALRVSEQAEEQHSTLLTNIDTYWEWHDARPLTPIRNEPFQNSSNVVLPLIRIHSDAIVSRLFNTIFAANTVWASRTRNEELREMSRGIAEFLNWAGDDNEFDLMMPTLDWISEAVPIGSAIQSLNWVTRNRQMFIPGEGGKPKPVTVEMHRGPVLEHIPRQDILWQAERPLQESEFVIQRSNMTATDIARNTQLPKEQGGWDPAVAEEIIGQGIVPNDRSDRVRQGQVERTGVDPLQIPDGFKPHDIRQMGIEWPLLKSMRFADEKERISSTPTPPIVVTFHRETGKVLRVIAKPYLIQGWNYYDAHYRREGQRPHQSGVCKLLEHMQRGGTTLVNQSIDAVTISNSVIGFTNDPKLLDQEWAPNKMLLVDQMDSFAQVDLSKLIQPDIALVTFLMGMAERLTGITDPNLGRDTVSGGHPSPATSTLTLLRESRELLRTSLKLYRRQFSRIAEDLATLYQQFESDPSGKLRRVLGPVDAQKVEQWLIPRDRPIAGNFEFDLRALSETLNPEEERQRALFVSQITADYYARIFQAIQVAAQAQQQQLTPLVQAAQKSIQAMTESYTRVLEASQIDDIEQFALQLGEQNSARAQAGLLSDAGQQVGDRLREVVGGNAGPPVATGPDGLPRRTNGAGAQSGL